MFWDPSKILVQFFVCFQSFTGKKNFIFYVAVFLLQFSSGVIQYVLRKFVLVSRCGTLHEMSLNKMKPNKNKCGPIAAVSPRYSRRLHYPADLYWQMTQESGLQVETTFVCVGTEPVNAVVDADL